MSTNNPEESKYVNLVQQAEEGTSNTSNCCGGGKIDACCGEGGEGGSNDCCSGRDSGSGDDCCGNGGRGSDGCCGD